ncbi:hypothetical protein K457DRAFT_883695 [Linnemannia elongata AG-77]|uniref:Uncharacterized protein n=1 Tax=Linnemannia elongata AG-77 TaxID=1314771 RepID=A0A197JF57_9FUNG|nr:hypothetical protein K457DRAFT_883695 [Linnemannia elongata AG-77]
MSFFIVRLSLFLSLPFPQSPSLAIPPHPSPFLGRFLSISLLHPTHYSHPSPSFVSHTSVPKLVPPLFFYPKKVRHSSCWRSIPAYGRYPPAINVKQQQREGKAMQNESLRFFFAHNPPSFSSFLPLSTKIINP